MRFENKKRIELYSLYVFILLFNIFRWFKSPKFWKNSSWHLPSMTINFQGLYDKNLRKFLRFFGRHLNCQPIVVGRGGFEPPKSKTSDLQSDPFGRSGICPLMKLLEPVIGLEPTTCWLQISCSANWATPAIACLSHEPRWVVPWGGIEPPTGRFSVPCSTDWATEAKQKSTF